MCATVLNYNNKRPTLYELQKRWSQHFIVLQLDRSFNTKEYRAHRKNLLLESEISKLPETMEAAENSKKKDELIDENRKLKELEKDLKDQLRNISDTYYTNQHTIYRIDRGDYRKGEDKKKFIMPCPEEECRGFLSSAYKCELCKLYTCPKCHEVVGDKDNPDHVCNEDSVKSAEMIKKDTKPCPSCGCRIFKIDGCDQMWCTTCHVAFSWRTGRRETGTIHNPHFYQWLSIDSNNGQAPRVAGDNPCGVDLNRMPNWWEFRTAFLRTLMIEHISSNKQLIRDFVVPDPFAKMNTILTRLI